jgi:two-component sensor histidine kinase
LVQQFNESFSARLQAMAAAQDMLSRSSWQRADLGAAPQSLLNSLKIRA